MSEIAKLEKQLAAMKKKEAEGIKITELKREIKSLQKEENIKNFDKKHPILSGIGKLGSAANSAIHKIAQPPNPTKKKYMEKNKKRLKELIEKY